MNYIVSRDQFTQSNEILANAIEIEIPSISRLASLSVVHFSNISHSLDASAILLDYLNKLKLLFPPRRVLFNHVHLLSSVDFSVLERNDRIPLAGDLNFKIQDSIVIIPNGAHEKNSLNFCTFFPE